MNAHEQAARAKKVTILVDAIHRMARTLDVTPTRVIEALDSDDRLWVALAKLNRVRPPSPETRRQITEQLHVASGVYGPQQAFVCAKHDGEGIAPGGLCPLCREEMH